MTVRPMLAVMVAVLIAASGAAGSFYLAGAQEQASVQEAEITLDGEASPGSEIKATGSGFAANSDISIYFMSAVQADLENGTMFILQEVANASASADPSGNFFDDALNELEGLLGLGGDEDAGEGQGSLLVSFEKPANGTIRLECSDEDIAEGELDGADLISVAAPPGTYDDCSVSISNGNITNAGEIGSLTVDPDPDEGYEDSLVAFVTVDDEGSFEESIAVPEVVEGDYAVLAVGSEGAAAVSELAVTARASVETSPNATGTTNQTMNQTTPTTEGNATVPENQTAENQPAQNQTDGNLTDADNQTGTVEARVQVVEEQVEAGEPLPISGEGFQPNTPVRIIINNNQITNVITNVEGSFNTVVIVPTTVNAGNAEVVVATEQITVAENVVVVEQDGQNRGPATVRFTSVSATDNAQTIRGAPVTIFDASSGEMVESGKTQMEIELEAGIYSVFYSDFSNFDFQSAEPGIWTDTPNGGSGLINVREGRNSTVTAMYSEQPAPPPPPRETENSLTLRSEDTEGEPIEGMFVTIYDADTGEKIEQGFTELTVEGLTPGTYPIFFANFANLEFVSASPGTWVKTPYGGAGLVTIPDDGEDHDIAVTAVYDTDTEVAEQQEFNIQAPLDIRGTIFTITSNETRPEGPFVMSGTVALSVDDEDPLQADLSAYIVSAREDSNENVDLESQRSRDHDTFQIVDFEPRVARPTGINSYLVSGSADLLLNGDVYSDDEGIEVMVRGGEELTPTNIEIEFEGDQRYSAANRLETLYGAVTSGFQ